MLRDSWYDAETVHAVNRHYKSLGWLGQRPRRETSISSTAAGFKNTETTRFPNPLVQEHQGERKKGRKTHQSTTSVREVAKTPAKHSSNGPNKRKNMWEGGSGIGGIRLMTKIERVCIFILPYYWYDLTLHFFVKHIKQKSQKNVTIFRIKTP